MISYVVLPVLFCSSSAAIDVAVIGAGVSGISAAKFLSQFEQFNVTVYEANPTRIGGRIWSYKIPNTSRQQLMQFTGSVGLHIETSFGAVLFQRSKNFGISDDNGNKG